MSCNIERNGVEHVLGLIRLALRLLGAPLASIPRIFPAGLVPRPAVVADPIVLGVVLGKVMAFTFSLATFSFSLSFSFSLAFSFTFTFAFSSVFSFSFAFSA